MPPCVVRVFVNTNPNLCFRDDDEEGEEDEESEEETPVKVSACCILAFVLPVNARRK